MRTITVTEETFDRLFNKAMEEFECDSYWMDRDEKFEDFKLTLTYKLLLETRSTIKHLKHELVRLE